jgi:hypothetical protein
MPLHEMPTIPKIDRAVIGKEEHMGLLDNLKDQSSNIMDDPDKRAQIEQMAHERNISIEEAKAHFMKQSDR